MELSVKKFNNNTVSSVNKRVTENDEILETERETHTEPFSRKKKIVLTGDSMVNGISEKGLSVNYKVKTVNLEKPEDLISDAGTNDITNNVNLSTKLKKSSTIEDITDRTDRSSCPEVFCKNGVLKYFAKFLEKHLCQSLFQLY